MSVLTAKLYDPAFVHRGPLPLEGGKVVLRNNDISTFLLDIDTSTEQWANITAQYGDMKAWHVQLFDSRSTDVPLMAGTITSDTVGRGDYPTAQWSGRCHLDYLDGMITLPNPSRAADNQTDGSHYKANGSASAVIHNLVRSHRADRSPTRPEFRTPLQVDSTVPSFGGNVRIETRFKPLLEEVQQLAKTGGTIFATTMDNDGTIRFVQSVPTDRSRYIRLSEDNDALGEWSMERTRPEVTKVLVAGQGEGDARTLILVEGNQNEWGVNRLVFQDRRDTDELADLQQAGEDTLLDNAETATISLDLVDTPDMEFGKDYWLGDIVTVQLADGATIIDGVQQVELDYNAQGRTGKVTVGPTGEEHEPDALVKLVKDLRARIQALETR